MIARSHASKKESLGGPRSVWILSCMIAAFGCRGGADGAGSGFTVVDSASVAIARSEAARWRGGEGWTIAPAPRVEIGAVEGDPAYQLFGVSAATRLEDGRLVVGNVGTSELRFYDGEGVHVRSNRWERTGSGRVRRVLEPRGLGWIPVGRRYRLPWDTERVWDVFNPAGRWLGPVTVPPGLRMLEIGGDYVLGRYADELGVERIRLHDLVKR